MVDGGDVKLKVWGLSTPGLSRQQLGDSDTLPFVNSVNSIVASTSPDINIVIRSDYHSRLLPDTSDKTSLENQNNHLSRSILILIVPSLCSDHRKL